MPWDEQTGQMQCEPCINQPLFFLWELSAIASACSAQSGRVANPFRPRSESVWFVFCILLWMLAVYLEIVWLGIVGVALIVYDAAENEWNNLFREGFRRILRYVFHRNAPPNPQK